MEGFSEEDLKLLNSFANENEITMDQDEFDLSLEALQEDSTIGNFELKAKDVKGAVENCLKDLNKKSNQEANGATLAAKNKDRQGSSEHLKMKQIYDIEITRLSKLPQITDSNANDIYDAIKDNLLLAGIDLDEFLPQDEGNFDDLEAQFGDELNELQGLPKIKRRPVEEVQEYLKKTLEVLNYRIEDELQNGKKFMQEGDRTSASECIKRKRLYVQELEVLESDQFQKIDKNTTNEIYIKIEEIVLKLSINFEKELNRSKEEIKKEEPKIVQTQPKKKKKKPIMKAKRIYDILDNYESFMKKKIEMETNIAKEYLAKKDKNGAALAIERQKIYKDRLENSPRSFMENLTDEDAAEMYSKLKQFFGVFQLEMDQFDPNTKLLTHEIFLQILDKYELTLKEKIVEDTNNAKELLVKQDKDRASQYLQRKKTYESELQNIPKDQIKSIPQEDLKSVYSNLGDHMKTFGIDIEELNPLNDAQEEEEAVENKVDEVSNSNLTHEIFIQILDHYEEILYKEMEKEVKMAKEFLGKKDKESASKHLQRKKTLEVEIASIPKEQLKEAPLDALPGAYDRLKEHMKTFGVNIDELNPMSSETPTETPKTVQNSPSTGENKVEEISDSKLTHEIFLEILEKYETHLYQKIEDDVKIAKDLLAKKDKEGASQYLQRKKVFETEVQNIPKEQLKSVDLNDLPAIYDRLKEHMKTFGANIDDLNPIKDYGKIDEVSDVKLTHEIFLQILDHYEEILKSKIEEDVKTAKELLAKKDKEAASQYIQRKKAFEGELQNIPKEQLKSVPVGDLPMIYDRLKEHMKIFGVNIDEINPLMNVKSTDDDLEALGLNPDDLDNLEDVEETQMTSKTLLQILDNLEITFKNKIEEITIEARDLLKSKDKEGATECLKKKKSYTTEIENLPKEQIKSMSNEDSINAYEGLKEYLLMNYDIDIEELNPNSPYFQQPKSLENTATTSTTTQEEKKPKEEKKVNYIKPNSKLILRSGYGYITFDQSAVTTGDKVTLDSIIQIVQVEDDVFALKGTKKYLHISKNGVRLDVELKPECKFLLEYPENENDRVGFKSATQKDMCFSIHKSLFSSAHTTKNPTIDTTFEVCFMDDILDLVPLQTTFLLKTNHETHLSLSKDGLTHRKVDKPTKAEVFEFIIIDNKLAIKSHYLGSMLMIDDDGNFKFTKSLTKKVRFQMHIFRVHKTNKIGIYMLRIHLENSHVLQIKQCPIQKNLNY
eukprot:gene3647-6463_t